MLTSREKRGLKFLVAVVIIAIAVFFLFFGKKSPVTQEAHAETIKVPNAEVAIPEVTKEVEPQQVKKNTKKATVNKKSEEVVVMSTVVAPEGGEQVAYEMSHNVYVEEAAVVEAPETYVQGGTVTTNNNSDDAVALIGANTNVNVENSEVVSSNSVPQETPEVTVVTGTNENNDEEIKTIVVGEATVTVVPKEEEAVKENNENVVENNEAVVENEQPEIIVNYGENKVEIVEQEETVKVVEINDNATTEVVNDNVEETVASTTEVVPEAVVETTEVVTEVVVEPVVDEVVENTTPSYTEMARDTVGGRTRVYTNDVEDMETIDGVLYLNYDLYY